MGLFSKWMKKKKEPRAFVFLCYAPSRAREKMINSHTPAAPSQFQKSLERLGYTGPVGNIEVFQLGWNKTVYSSYLLQGEGELDDMIARIKAAVRERGYAYNGEKLGGSDFVAGSKFNLIDVFMVYFFTD